MHRSITILIFCSVACITQVAVAAYGDLANDSPFLPERTTNAPVAKQLQPAPVSTQPLDVEYGGLIRLGNRTMVSLRNTQSNRQQWVPLGESAFGLTVREVSTDSMQVSLERDGSLYYLTLRNADGSTAGTPNVIASTKGVGAEKNRTPYASLNPKLRERFFHPRFIPTLEASGIEVPSELRRRAVGYQESSASVVVGGSPSQSVSSSATSDSRNGKINPNPTLNTALTVEEKIERSIANGYAYQP